MHTGLAMQLTLIALLNTEFANEVCAAVVAGIFGVFEFFFLGRVDAPDITNHMTGQVVVGVIAKQTGTDLNAWKSKALGSKTRYFFIA